MLKFLIIPITFIGVGGIMGAFIYGWFSMYIPIIQEIMGKWMLNSYIWSSICLIIGLEVGRMITQK